MPPLWHLHRPPNLRFDSFDHRLHEIWIRLRPNAAVPDTVWRPVVIETGELPITEPIHRPLELSLPFSGRRWIVNRVTIFPKWFNRTQPAKHLKLIRRL